MVIVDRNNQIIAVEHTDVSLFNIYIIYRNKIKANKEKIPE